MRYIDPFDFLKIDIQNEEEYSAPVFAAAARNVLLKFDHSKAGQLAYEGELVSRQAAEALIDGFKQPEIRGFHFRIKALPGLQQFLVRQDVTQIKKIGAQIIQKDPSFNDFCSPFLAYSFERVLATAIKQQHWAIAVSILANLHLLRPNDVQDALISTSEFVAAEIKNMEKALNQGPNPTMSMVQFANELGETANAQFLNALPDTQQALRLKYAVLLGQIASQVYHAGDDVKVALKIAVTASNINSEPSIAAELRMLRGRIQKAHSAQFGDPIEEEYEKQVSWHKTGVLITGFLGVLFAIIRMLIPRETYNNDYYRSAYKFSPKTEVNPYFEAIREHRTDVDIFCERLYTNYSTQNFSRRTKKPRPKTGWNPYFGSIGEDVWEMSTRMLQFNFSNQSPKDLVLIVKERTDAELLSATYIRAHETSRNIQIPDLAFQMVIFNGENWIESVADYGKENLGGFQSNIDFIGQYAMDENTHTTPFLEVWPQNLETEIPSFYFKDNKIGLKK